MRIWWTTAWYELLKFIRKPVLLLIMIGLPLVLIFLLGSAFDTGPKPAKVIVYNADQGTMKESVEQFWTNEQVRPYAERTAAGSEKEVKNAVMVGEADYGIVIPADFSERTANGESAVWHTYSGRFAEKNLAVEAVIDSYLSELNLRLAAQNILGQNASVPDGSGHPPHEKLVAIGSAGDGQDTIFGSVSSMQYYAVAYLIMFLLYGGMSAAIELLNQKQNGTLQRMFAMPASFRMIVLGLFTGSLLLAALQGFVIVLISKFAYGVDWGSGYAALALIGLLTAAAGAGLAIVIAAFAKTAKTTLTLFGIAAFSMTFISGGMIAGIDSVIGGGLSKFSINHWANESLRQAMSGAGWSAYSHEIGILAAIAAVFAALAIICLPKVVKRHA